MQNFTAILTAGNLVVATMVAAGGMVCWLGTLTWKLSGALSALSLITKETQTSIKEFRLEVRDDMKEMRRELTEINVRLSRVEGHVGIIPAKPSN